MYYAQEFFPNDSNWHHYAIVTDLSNSYLKAYDQISKGMQIDLGDRANCVNLIPLYEKSYEEKKNDGIWLQRALNRLFNKECVDSELFVKILQQKNSLEPDASTSYYLGIIKD